MYSHEHLKHILWDTPVVSQPGVPPKDRNYILDQERPKRIGSHTVL